MAYKYSKIKCKKCRMYEDMCLCSEIAKLALPVLKTKITLIMHIKEWLKQTNTGKIVEFLYPNHDLILKGDIGDQELASFQPDTSYENLILSPAGGSQLTNEYLSAFSRPVNLIVPDGTWSQARKIIRRNSNLLKLPKVRLKTVTKSGLYIRKHPEMLNVSTIEAVSEALSILENEAVKENFLNLFKTMMHNLYRRRGIMQSCQQ